MKYRKKTTIPMKKTCIILSIVLIVAAHLPEKNGNPGESGSYPRLERVFLTENEEILFEYIVARMSQEGKIPSQGELNTTFGHAIEDDVRAKLSAKLYYERGIVGALLSADETNALHQLFHHRRSLGSLGELTDRIRGGFSHPISTRRSLQILEFLYAAGYIDLRKNGKRVYLSIPKGLKTLYVSSSVKHARSPHESNDSPTVDLTSSPFQEKPSPPALSEERNISPIHKENRSPSLDVPLNKTPEMSPPVSHNVEHGEESEILLPSPELPHGVKDEIEPAAQVIRTFEIPNSTGKESMLSIDSTYTLQVAAYRKKSDAKHLQQWLRERGYQTRIEALTIPESGPWYRVRFGMYDSYNATKKTAETFRKQFGFYCWIVPVDS